MIAVLQKVFRILEAFARLGDPVSLADLTEATRLPKPTVYRLLQSLVELGYVMQEPRTGFYLRTPSLDRLGLNSRNEYLRQRLRPLVDKLHARFHETVTAAVLCDRRIEYLLVRESRSPLRRVLLPGDGDPFQQCAPGRAIAAFLPDAEQQVLLNGQSRKASQRPNSQAAKVDFHALLQQVRQRGWALDDQECVEGVVGLAVPVLEAGLPIAALGFYVPAIRLDSARRQAMVEALLHARPG